jgi:hypothetical protein
MQVGIGLLAFIVTLTAEGLLYWVTGSLLALVSLALSWHILRRKAHLWQALTRRFRH